MQYKIIVLKHLVILYKILSALCDSFWMLLQYSWGINLCFDITVVSHTPVINLNTKQLSKYLTYLPETTILYCVTELLQRMKWNVVRYDTSPWKITYITKYWITKIYLLSIIFTVSCPNLSSRIPELLCRLLLLQSLICFF